MAWDSTSAEGILKRRYGDLVDAVPESSWMRKNTKYSTADRVGDGYYIDVELQREHGWTLQSGSASTGAFTLDSVRTGQLKPANVSGATFVMRSSFGYKQVIQASEKGENALASVFDVGVKSMLKTSNLILDILLLYGQSPTGIGVFAANGTSATTDTHELTTASSCIHMLVQLEGAPVDVYDPTLTTRRNTNGALIIGSVDAVSGTTTQAQFTLTGAAADNLAVVSGDVMVLRNSVANGTMAGLDKIVTNTGTLFGISASTYPSWKGNTYSAASTALTFGRLMKAAIPVAQRSDTSECTAGVSIATWADLNNDAAAIRREMENKGRVEFGSKKIVYHGPSGIINIEPVKLMKNGEAHLVAFETLKRLGESDVSFNIPGVGQNQRMLRELADSAGFEIRCLWDQCLMPEMPRALCKVDSIVNSTS